MVKKELFDKKFVIAAIILGIVYVLIVVLVGSILGKEAAGVAGVALTALATALFKKFETLQFRRMAEEETVWVDVPPVDIWRVAILTFAFVGAMEFLGFFLIFLPEKWVSGGWLFMWAVGLTFLVYFVLSFVMAKAFVGLRYSAVAFAVLITQITSALHAFVFYPPEVSGALQYGLGPTFGFVGAICIIFEVVAFLGVRLGLPNQSLAEKPIESSAS